MPPPTQNLRNPLPAGQAEISSAGPRPEGRARGKLEGASVRYPNWISRILLKRAFERQFVIPLFPPSRLVESALKLYERAFLRIDIDEITIDRPIFLVGLPRSGTTMLQDILCSHPVMAYFTNTMHQFRSCFCAAEDLHKRLKLDFRGERYLADGVEIGPGTPSEGHCFLADWHGVDPYSPTPVSLEGNHLSGEESKRAQETIRKVLWCFGGNGRRFFLKNSVLIQYLRSLYSLFPDAKIIHLVRDPRMCANSMVKLYRLNREQEIRLRARMRHGDNRELLVPFPRFPRLKEYLERFGPEDLRTTACLWRDGISIIHRDKDQLPFFYEVRYEDILARPTEEISKILEFCDLPPLEDRSERLELRIRQVGNDGRSSGYANFDLVEKICADQMRRYGYL